MPLWWRTDRLEGILVRALHDGEKISIAVTYEDPSQDGLQLRTQDFTDGAAIQLSADPDPPFFGMGDARSAVNIWMWKASWEADLAANKDLEDIYPGLAVDAYPSLKKPPFGAQVDKSKMGAAEHDPTFLSGWGAGNFLSDPARGTLTFFDQAGQSRAVAINGLGAASSMPYDIAPLGSAVFTASVEGPVRLGSARAVVAEGVIGAVLRLASPTAGTVSAGPSGVFAGLIAPAHRNRGTGLNTEVALSSTEFPLTLTLVLRDDRGTEVQGGRAQLQLPANGQTRQTIDQLFPNVDTDNVQGTLTVTADGGTVAAEVTQVGGDAGALAVMPVAPLP
jgi:hypothetical protein